MADLSKATEIFDRIDAGVAKGEEFDFRPVNIQIELAKLNQMEIQTRHLNEIRLALGSLADKHGSI